MSSLRRSTSATYSMPNLISASVTMPMYRLSTTCDAINATTFGSGRGRRSSERIIRVEKPRHQKMTSWTGGRARGPPILCLCTETIATRESGPRLLAAALQTYARHPVSFFRSFEDAGLKTLLGLVISIVMRCEARKADSALRLGRENRRSRWSLTAQGPSQKTACHIGLRC